MTYSEAHSDTNAAAVTAATDGLTLDQLHTFHAYALGALAGHVDPTAWASVLDNARRFATR